MGAGAQVGRDAFSILSSWSMLPNWNALVSATHSCLLYGCALIKRGFLKQRFGRYAKASV